MFEQRAYSKTSERKRPKDDIVVNTKKIDEPPVKKRWTMDKQIAKARSEPPAGKADHLKPNLPIPLVPSLAENAKSGKVGKG